VPIVDRGERFRSVEPSAFPVPTGREEDWRFTPMPRLRGLHDGTAAAGGKVLTEVAAPPGVTVEVVRRGDVRLGRIAAPVDRVSAQAWAGFDEATVITIGAESTLVDPVLVNVHGEGSDAAAYGHLLIEVEPFAKAVVVIDHTGSALYADNVEAVLADGSQLTLVSLHDWDDDSVHVSSHNLSIGKDATLRQVVVSLGGNLVRVAPSVSYTGSGGDATLLGLFFADDGQHLEHRLFVDHAVPHCRSRVNYKGALQGAGAHSVWIGDVLIRSSAIGTDTYEVNRNLLLTDGARADSVPNLEIETGEVTGAGHASATGRFDDDQLFYLMSRGIASDEARRLVVRGFFAEVAREIGVPSVQARLEQAIEDEFEQVVGAGSQ
jgi:Fe-S cluster assembly protein SufD